MNPFPKLARATTRMGTLLRRRYSGLRHYVPFPVVRLLNATASMATGLRRLYLPVKHASEYANLFHCTFHKTGSQWIKSLLTDPVTFQYSGLRHFHYQSRWMSGFDERPFREKTFPRGFPEGTIVSPLYVSLENFLGMPKAGPYRVFAVIRDPREMTVSWYFSTLKTHVARRDSPMLERRRILQSLDAEEGLAFAIDHLARIGIYEEMVRWWECEELEDELLTVKYEELVSADTGFATFKAVFAHLGIPFPDSVLRDLLESYSFARLSGRKKGDVKKSSHLRAGGAATWPDHFTPALRDRFVDRAGDAVERLGYDG